ncbi:MAG: CGNR zinc finger domain-containing protein [Acidobacteria bacterium]|nr:MAG: CGNR zinc finger domain-containing protein [Acidobacteriota bacterium]
MTRTPIRPSRSYPPWPASLPPAPGDLRVLQAFVNTRDIEGGTDELESAAALGAWLAAWGLLPEGTALGTADLEQARAVREALRRLLLANNGAPLDKRAVEILDRAADKAPLRARFSPDGAVGLEPAAPSWQGALARLLELVVAAWIEGLWPRLKACPNDECQWAFYDFSKNRSSKWCTMKRCGNLMNARAYRKRRKSQRG